MSLLTLQMGLQRASILSEKLFNICNSLSGRISLKLTGVSYINYNYNYITTEIFF